ncbi:MAG: UDP-glucose 4-epimerase GalE [Pseudomonadota bacterium]
MSADIRPEPAVLVTGGAGYIGSHVALALLDAGYNVVVLDNLATGFASAVPSAATFRQGDIADCQLVSQIIHTHNIDSVIHLGGSLLVGESSVDPLKYFENNVGGSSRFLRAAVKAGVRHVVFSSTAAVYGETESQPVREDCPTEPINPYGTSKLIIEGVLAASSRAHDFNYSSLRYFNVAGADPSGRSGQSSSEATHLIKVACEAACGKREGVRIFGDDYDTPDGTCVRDFIHVSDLAAAHVDALERLRQHPDEDLVLNCGYGHGYSVKEVLAAVERVSGYTFPQAVDARRAGDPAALVADNGKLLRTLPWRPRYDDLDLIVAHALNWERKLAGYTFEDA